MRARFLTALGFAALVLTMTLSEQPAYSHRPITTPIIFKKEIAQIFQRKCFNCHSENNLAMSLTTYEVARPWARAIREEAVARRMPPWGAVEGFGHFSNDVSLTQREMDIVLSWADGGAPSGVLKVEESIPPVFVPTAPQWDAGQPDEILTTPASFKIEPGSGNQVHRYEITSASTAPRAVKGFAFKPGDRRVVRYAAIFDATGRWLWTWTPWQTYQNLPEGVVYKLPARARLAVEIGYRAADEPADDKSEVGLYFGDLRATREAASIVLASEPVEIAPHTRAHKVRVESVVSSPQLGFAVWPDLAEGVKSIELAAIDGDGVTEPLLWIKDVRRSWPTPYVFLEPTPLARGTRLVLTAYYENTTDAPRRVKAGATLVTYPDAGSRSLTREGRHVEGERHR